MAFQRTQIRKISFEIDLSGITLEIKTVMKKTTERFQSSH